MKWIFWSFVAALCVLSGNLDGASPKEAGRKQEHEYNHRDPETREKDMGSKDIRRIAAVSSVVALLTFSSLTCVFVAVHCTRRARVFAVIQQHWLRTTSETDEPPRYRYRENDSSSGDDNSSVITGSDDTQSLVDTSDDVTDPKAVRPRSLASSTETLQDAFRDAQVYISEHIGINWKSLSNHLPGKRLTKVQLDCIVEENRLVADRAMKMLCKWKQLNGSKANIERMARGLDACGQKKIARKVRELWSRTTSKTDDPIYKDSKNDSSSGEDNSSVITGSDDTQSELVDIDDDTDPKAARPRSLASSTKTLQDAFRDAQVYISENIGINWKSLSNHLPGKRLTEVQLECIEDENRLVADRAMKMLCKWKQLNGSKANIERMAKGLDACGQKKIARKVKEMGL